ncbi:MAG: propionyl-CoA carboxylase [Rhodobacteraceae bacterium]|nr:propionyl-CoA carboxylase [Paracoccaceae bacterium]
MSWQPEVDEIQRRKLLAEKMGGEESLAKMRAAGKLNARERVDQLVDKDSFREIGTLTGSGTYDADGNLVDLTPSNAIIGTARIDGRKVLISADDFSIRGGSSESTISDKWIYAERMALELGLPLVRLVDTAGGSVKLLEKQQSTKIPGYATWEQVRMLGEIPVVGIALGACAGLGAIKVVGAHLSIMVKGQSQIFAAGPYVVKEGLGIDVTKDELGGSAMHARGSGLVDNEATDEADAFAQTRRFLSYLPPNVHTLPPVIACDDPADRRDDYLLTAIPREKRRAYQIRKIIAAIFDRDSFFEMGRYSGRSSVTGLARLNGRPVGILANDPTFAGGAMTLKSSAKIESFVDFCDTFHIPVVSLFDQPGIMIGPDAEKSATIRAAMRALAAIDQSRVPWCTVIIRRAFGVAGAGHGRLGDINLRYAWPSASWGSIPLEGGITAAYRRQIEAAEDPEAFKQQLHDKYSTYTSPFRTAERFGINDIIDPRDTRPLLCDWMDMAWDQLPRILGPAARTMRK